VRSAASFALAKNIDAKEMKADWKTISVDAADFDRAIEEVIPAFGQKNNEEIANLFRNGIYSYGPAFSGPPSLPLPPSLLLLTVALDLYHTILQLLNQTRNSERTPLMSVLLEGQRGTGKVSSFLPSLSASSQRQTALAAKLAVESDFPLVRLVSPDAMIGMQDSQKCQLLLKVFNDAYRSPLSVIFIDDIERIIEYTPIGHRSLAILPPLTLPQILQPSAADTPHSAAEGPSHPRQTTLRGGHDLHLSPPGGPAAH
jgi:vesicle-fusing ATPase